MKNESTPTCTSCVHLNDELIEIIKDKMLKTAKALIEGRLFLPEDFDEIALEAWQRMIHEIFLDNCPCQTKTVGVCLQEYEPQDLVEIIGDCMFGFYQFLDGIKEGERRYKEIIF